MAVDTIRADATVDPAEVARFSRLAGKWWDPHGLSLIHI